MFGLVKRVNSRFPNLERPVFIFELNYSGGQNKRAAKFNLTAEIKILLVFTYIEVYMLIPTKILTQFLNYVIRK